MVVWRGRPLTQNAREKGSGNQPILHWNAAVGTRLLNTLAMAAFIEQGVNKGVNKPHSISSTLKVLFPGMVPLWYRLITRPLLPRFLGKGSATPD